MENVCWPQPLRGVVKRPRTIYLSEERALAARDVIRFTRGDELVKNGHEATVVSIQGNQAVLRLADGKEIPWDLDAQRHWDHAYAATVHAGQGATREQAILHIPSEKLGRDPDDPRRQSYAVHCRRLPNGALSEEHRCPPIWEVDTYG
ncbi:hypothetical protein [Burkholderia glumae]|uniref:hypothetical protein n=1 Tax=Burkholderia glumae TaxID=337 RepID=UPI002150FA19|nr:hypothetical protein [Burkholderia glumae]